MPTSSLLCLLASGGSASIAAESFTADVVLRIHSWIHLHLHHLPKLMPLSGYDRIGGHGQKSSHKYVMAFACTVITFPFSLS
jgi:hypothetical protein